MQVQVPKRHRSHHGHCGWVTTDGGEQSSPMPVSASGPHVPVPGGGPDRTGGCLLVLSRQHVNGVFTPPSPPVPRATLREASHSTGVTAGLQLELK